MNTNRLDLIADHAIQYFGTRNQKIKAIEELSELIQALAKEISFRPPGSHEDSFKYTGFNTMEEIADCIVILHQLRFIYGPHKIDDLIEFKIDRLEKRMKDVTHTDKGNK